jgi:hypothetical protein
MANDAIRFHSGGIVVSDLELPYKDVRFQPLKKIK